MSQASRGSRNWELPDGIPRRWLIVTQNYAPEPGATSVRLGVLAGILRELGMEVEVFTGMPNYPLGVIPEKYRGRWTGREVIDGITVHRTWVYGYGGANKLKRGVNLLSFTFSGMFNLFCLQRPDVVFLESFPLPVGLLGLLSKYVWRVPYIYNIPDLQVESAREGGWVGLESILKIAAWFENLVMRNSWQVSVVTRGFKEYFHRQRGIDRAKIALLPNGADPRKLKPLDPDQEIIRTHGLDGKIVFMYAGMLYPAHRAEVIVEAADLLRDRDDIRFFFLGGGVTRQKLIDLTRDKGLNNVVFGKTSYALVELPRYMSVARAAVVTLSDTPLHSILRVAKTFPPLACRKPVIFSGRCESGDLLRENDCGIVTAPEDAGELAAAVVRLADDEAEAGRLGRNGLAFIEREMTWLGIVRRWLDELKGLERG